MIGKKLRRSGLIAVLAAATVLGCSNDGNQSVPAALSDGSFISTEDITFTYFLFTQGKKDTLLSETRIGEVLQEQTGVDFKLQYLVGDSATKAGVMIASGDYPDVISSSGEMARLMDAGAYIPLNDLIEQYGPNIKRVYGPYFHQMKAQDGKIYTLPFTANQGYTEDADIRGGAFYIQRSVLKEFGYPKIRTLDEYMDVIQRYKAIYPRIDGQDTIGFTIPAAVTNSFYSLQNPAMHLAGYPNDGHVMIDPITQQAEIVAGTGYQRRWIRKLNEIHSIGLFDPESFTMNKDQYLEKLTSGRVLGYFSYAWQVVDANNDLKAAGIDDKRYAPLPLVFDEGIKDQYIDPRGFVNNYGIGISIKAEDPVRIIQYFDNLLKEENQVLISWGIEGETYSVDDNGRFYFKGNQADNHVDPEMSRSFGFSYFYNDWPRYGINSLLMDGNAYSPYNQPEVYTALYTDGDKEILKAYGSETFSGYFSKPDERKWFPAWSISNPLGSPEQVFISRSDDLQKKYLSKLILEPPDAFESTWDAYMIELNKLDKDVYEATMTRKVKDRVAGKW